MSERVETQFDDEPEMDNVDYLRDLAERIFKIPVMYGVDGYDYDRLHRIAKEIT